MLKDVLLVTMASRWRTKFSTSTQTHTKETKFSNVSAKQTILVFGATGKQGSATIKALDQTKFKILAVTPDASSEKAKAIGVDLIEGSLENPESLFDKEPIHGVLLVLANTDPEGHLQEGLAIVNAAAKHGVKHFVYSNGDYCGRSDTGIPFFEAKRKIENAVKAQSFQWTILGPIKYRPPGNSSPQPTYKVIATSDIGKIAAEVFANPDRFEGKKINIVGDELTPDEIISIWKEVTGQTLQAEETPVFPPFIAPASKFFDDSQFEADVSENKKLFPFLTDFKSWLQQTPFAKK
ncbi:hypothetical protein L486_06124 [Kwoniella mangroviensis CBS 10435]|uniref:NmrA-like domain-containing protein n=1 Tax=Kwoniella mangroviensis CBS 10435 TaxID=1331196 RepID=A0A1B9IL27_9TREE|nr:hypothetical protein L486_06124 [Kwoniella mangroviensis CBS 10435]